MPDRPEIEAKFALNNPAKTRTELLRLGADVNGSHAELNTVLDDDQHSLTARGILLRVRRLDRGKGTRYQLTTKVPIPNQDAAVRARREIELTIGDGQAMIAALDVLGYRPIWRYEKRRETFHLQNVIVTLDEVPIGWFAELEGTRQAIRALAKQLGLDMQGSITRSYAELFMQARDMLGFEIEDMTFKALAGYEIPTDLFDV